MMVLQIFDKITYTTRRYVQDMFTTYRVFMNCERIVFGHKPKYYYFQRSNSIQNTRDKKLDWDQFCVDKDCYENLSVLFPEWRMYLLIKWISFTVSAYNSMLLRIEMGEETCGCKQEMLKTINMFYHEVSLETIVL